MNHLPALAANASRLQHQLGFHTTGNEMTIFLMLVIIFVVAGLLYRVLHS